MLIWLLRFSCSCPRWGYTDVQALAVTRTKPRFMPPVSAGPYAPLSSAALSQEPRALAVQWRRCAVTPSLVAILRMRGALLPAAAREDVRRLRPRGAPLQLQKGGWRMRNAPVALRGCCLHHCGLSVSAALRMRWLVAGFSRPVCSRLALRWPLGRELGAARYFLTEQRPPHHGSKTLMAGQWKSIPCIWEAQMNYPANSKQ